MTASAPAPPRVPGRKRRVRKLPLIAAGMALAILLTVILTLGSFRMPFEPESPTALLILFCVSMFVVVAFLVFSFVLLRSLLRLWTDRRTGLMGSRFRTKMVFGAMGISLLPVVLLFMVSYALLNRTLTKWFPHALEVATDESVRLLSDMSEAGAARRAQLAAALAPQYSAGQPLKIGPGYDGIWRLNSAGYVTDSLFRDPPGLVLEPPHWVRTLPSGSEAWQSGRNTYLAARTPLPSGALVLAQRMPDSYLARLDTILGERQTYLDESRQLKAFRLQMLLSLLLITLLLLFSTTWVALFLEKQVTVPVQALAEATREISLGNLEHRVAVRAQDELGILVDSFNRMTGQLHDARDRLEESNANLQRAFQEMEQRRLLMETILENIPTGVLSLDSTGAVERVNSSVVRMFGDAAPSGGCRSLESLLGAGAAHNVERLMRRSLRMGAVSQELEIPVPGRPPRRAAVTVSSLGPRRANPGYVVVIDDLSDLLHAQKTAAWQEVAQRIAHEIKNPLTPIQLSAQRLERFLERRGKGAPVNAESARELESLVAECAGLIEREVAALGNLVDAFSRLARFPEAQLAPTDLNRIAATALEVFAGRLDGVTVRTNFSPNLPPIRADAELLRRVIVNLIDNAAEAMEDASTKEITLTTRPCSSGETLELIVADTGHGVAPQDKDRLFLPHFSTRQRGTGLGLAIAERIVAEHHGAIRVEDNQPQGARFIIRLPAADLPAAAATGAANGATAATAPTGSEPLPAPVAKGRG
ncbi:MAG TPA: ATP-binding protein [Candidatus Acidoferrales bacterium]|nr:ATP-binding protein [Candidatus Acidoferrales bacterium]